MEDAPETPDTFLGYPCVPAWELKYRDSPLFGAGGSAIQHWALAVLVKEKYLVVIGKPGAFGHTEGKIFVGIHKYTHRFMSSIFSNYYDDGLAAHVHLRKELQLLIGEP